MKQHAASKLLRGFKQAFSEQTVTAIGRTTGFLKRERNMTLMKMIVIPAIVEALLMSSPRRLRAAFMQAIDYLAINAQRAHPHRDRCRRRC